MTIDKLNTFCRRYDLIFKEMGRIEGVDVYWFIDFDNETRHYTHTEICSKLDVNLVST